MLFEAELCLLIEHHWQSAAGQGRCAAITTGTCRLTAQCVCPWGAAEVPGLAMVETVDSEKVCSAVSVFRLQMQLNQLPDAI